MHAAASPRETTEKYWFERVAVFATAGSALADLASAGRLTMETRIAELIALTDWPAGADHHQQVARASGVINVAALITSDIGLADLAEDLCWRLHAIVTEPREVTPDVAVMALKPLTNIARLLIREGQPTEAYELLQRLYHAARHREVATIRGQDIDLSVWTRTREHHRRICTELWSTLLIDDARALARAGRWTRSSWLPEWAGDGGPTSRSDHLQ